MFILTENGRLESQLLTENGSSSSGRRYVGICYYNLTSKTVVWVANYEAVTQI
jgi:hypothetical protein